MKTFKSFILFTFLLQVEVFAQTQYKWENPCNQTFQVIKGQAFCNELKGTYARLPDRAKDKVRKPLWDLSRQSAGLSICFYSNAPEIKVRYKVNGGLSMPHMPCTGVSGVDLYAQDINGRQRWCGFSFSFNDTITYTFSNLTYETDPKKGYEYQLLLPLYNSVTWMEIGVPTDASFSFIPASKEKPLVIYGTSIAQGACASRPGMAWGNIIGRMLQHPVVNLGFSGNGKLEPELFDLLSEIDAQLYMIDCMPNLPGETDSKVIYERTLAGVKKLREKSQAPILLVEHAGYTNEFSSEPTKRSYQLANIELKKAYDALQKEAIPQIYYLTKEEIELSMDAAVEGVHPNDLGMQQYADGYIRKIREILHEKSQGPSTCIPCKQHRDPYDWNDRHEAVLQLNKEDAPEILMIGNSITHFWGGEPAGPQRGKESWDKLFKGKHVRNLGFGWDKIENMLWRIYHGELDGYQAKDIVALPGTNNLQSNTDEEILQGISTLIEAIQERQPTARLCILGIYPRKDMEERVKLFNAKLKKELADKKVIYLDLASYFTNKDGSINWNLFSDGLHPTKEGYNLIAKGLKEKFFK